MDTLYSATGLKEGDLSWLPLLLDNTNLLLGYIGTDKKHRYVNAEYANWFLKEPEEVVGRSLEELAHDPASYAAVEPYESRSLAGEHVHFNIELPEPAEGKIDIFVCNFVPHRDKESNEVLGVLFIAESRTYHEQVVKEKEGSEHRFKSLTNTIPQLLWTANPDGTVDYVNQRCADFTGKPKNEFGTAWVNTLHPDDKQRIIDSWLGSMESGKPFREEYRLQNTEGEYRWFVGHAVPIKNEKGELAYWIGTATDIEEEKRKSEELNKTRIAAEDANRAKSAFLANISHELRTPLGVVLGFSRLLEQEGLTAEKRKKYSEAIQRNGKMLTKIIDDLLDLTRIEAGSVVVEKSFFSPSEMLTDIVGIFKHKAEAKEINLTLKMDPEVPGQVFTDPVRLRQILINIIGNAIKFTDQGSVDVKMHSQKLVENRFKLEIEVKDTGCGMTEDQSRLLFEPFYQTDPSLTRQHGGVGLGLSISKRLANALAGDISVTKFEIGKGSTFTVTVEAEVDPNQEVSNPSPSSHSQEGQALLAGKRFLVVDDAPDNLELVREVLTNEGARVDIASGGQNALTKAQGADYDLIFLDLQMPHMDGYETLKALRRQGCQVPVVALTAHAMASEVGNTQEAGFAGHVAKPVNFKKLIQAAMEKY